jgi:hypothetical protein
MIHNWKTLVMYSLLSAAAFAFVLQPAVLFAEETNLLAKIEALSESKKLSAADKDEIAGVLRKELKRLEEGALANLQKSVDSLKLEVSALQLEQLRHKVLIEQLSKRLDAASASPGTEKAMLETLKAIQDGIAKLAPTEKRVMMYPPNNGITANMGRIVLVNQYSDELSFFVNGVGHRMPALTSRVVDSIPTGTVTVDVYSPRFGGVFNRQATTLAAGETFTVTANPPR